MGQYPRNQEDREWRGSRVERERPPRPHFPENDDPDNEWNRGYGGRSERDFRGQEAQGFNRHPGRDWRDDERMNWEDFGREPFRGESPWNRGYRSQEMMESRGMQGSRNREDYGRQGTFGQEGRGRWGGGEGYGQGRQGGWQGQGGYGQGWQGSQGGQGWQGSQGWQGGGGGQRGFGSQEDFSQTGEYFQGRGYGQGGTHAQTGKYGQIGAQMTGERFGEGYGQGTYGGFRGKGPKGYERSDERLKEMISERLTDDDHIDASDITVEVRNGEVTLTGTVDDRTMKFQAEELIERCGGVKDIHNHLRVSPERQMSQTEQMGQAGQTGQTGKKDMMTTKAGTRGNS